MYTLQQSINYAETYIQYSPLAVGTGNEPALSIANEIQAMITNAPFVWPWNRNDAVGISVTPGIQTYTITLTDFNFLEKVSLINSADQSVYEVLDIYNQEPVGFTSANTNKRGRPNAISVYVVDYGNSLQLRFMGSPDANYNAICTYQRLLTPLTSLASDWGIPDQYLDIYNNLFVGEAMAVVDDARANQYRQRGVAALLSKQQGLSQMQKDLFLQQYWSRDSQMLANQLRTTQANQARGI